MDIQQNDKNTENQQKQSQKPQFNQFNIQNQRPSVGQSFGNNNRLSFQNRKSNESFQSFGRMSIQQPYFCEGQKISLQSNISLKARQKYENGDLFQNLANQGRSSFGNNLMINRQQGSYKQYYNNPQSTNFQVHFPLHSNFGLSKQFSNSYFTAQQFKQRSSQGTTNNNHNQSYENNSTLLHNQSQQNIKTKIFQQDHAYNNSNFNQNSNKFNEPQLKNENIQGLQKQKIITCKCPRSKCLLMYCECFSKGILCNSACSCYQCRNNPDFQEKRQNARRIVLQRDPNAFSNKLEVVGGQQSQQLAYKRGCNCKKTNCFKKYCECFYAGVKCTYLCKCQNCMNGGQNAFKV